MRDPAFHLPNASSTLGMILGLRSFIRLETLSTRCLAPDMTLPRPTRVLLRFKKDRDWSRSLNLPSKTGMTPPIDYLGNLARNLETLQRIPESLLPNMVALPREPTRPFISWNLPRARAVLV